MASARVGSWMAECHLSTGSWLATTVDRLWARSSITSRRSRACGAVTGARPKSSRISNSHRDRVRSARTHVPALALAVDNSSNSRLIR